MKIDLCKIFGVEEGEEFKIDGFSFPYRIRGNRLEHYDSNFKQWIYSTLGFNKLIASEIIRLPKKKRFSQDTLNFFKLVDKKWKWIAKDDDGLACLYDVKPTKSSGGRWHNNNFGGDWCAISDINDSLFEQILCDEEPIRIDDYVER